MREPLFIKWKKEYEEIMRYQRGASIIAYLEMEERGVVVPVLVCVKSEPDRRSRYFRAWITQRGDVVSETIGFTEVI